MDKRPNHYYGRTYYQAHHQPPAVRPRKPKMLHRIFSSSLLILIVAVAALLWVKHGKASAHKVPVYQPNAQAFLTLSQTVNSVIKNYNQINFEVSVLGPGDNNPRNFGDTVAMDAASEAKLITAGDFLQEVEARQDSLGETLDDGNFALSDLKALIVQSDDNAWQALNDELGTNSLQNYADSLGLSYNQADNTMSASSATELLARLDSGQLFNASDTQLLLSYLGQANYRDFIVPAVPAADQVYHKTGLDNDEVNDAAIITHDGQAVAVSIFTNGNGIYQWDQRAQIMQQITKAVLSCYFGQS